jgi:gamma-carbonic anhydrase
MNLMDAKPIIGENVFLAPSASVIGRVELGASSSVWYGAVVRADVNTISIGARSNVQDRAVLYVTKSPASEPTVIGSAVSIGHGAVVHGATIADEAMIGMGAVVENGARVGKHALVAAGSVVPAKAVVGAGELWAGAPAAMVRKLTQEEIDAMIASAEDCVTLAGAHAEEAGKTHEQIEGEKLRRQLLDERSDDYNSHLGKLGQERELVEVQAQLIEKNRKALSSS